MATIYRTRLRISTWPQTGSNLPGSLGSPVSFDAFVKRHALEVHVSDQTFPVGNMHINLLSELTALNEPWKADRLDKDLTRLFVINGNISQGNFETR